MNKVGRNDACPCGSGKKYKQCCMRTEAAPAPVASAQLLQLAFAQHMAGHVAQARAVYRDVLNREPRNAAAWHLYGVAAGDSGDYAAAIEHIGKAIALNAGNHSFHANLGRMFTLTRRHAEAEQCYRRALALKAECAYHDNLGNALREQRKLAEAEASYRSAIMLDARYAGAHRNLGDLLQLTDRPDEAFACYRQALELQPDNAEIYSNIGLLLMAAGDFDGAIAQLRQALALAPANIRSADNLLYAASIQYAPRDYLAAARSHGADLIARAQRDPAWPAFAARANASTHAPGPLRIGLVSGDFRDHPVSSFLQSILPHLQATALELFAYPTTLQADAVTASIQPYFAGWRPLAGLHDAAAAQAIDADGIHILVDLAGYTAGNRLGVFAWRPAPVQIGWLGYWASTGLDTMDYVLADPYSLPADAATDFSERPWHLPDTRLCYTPPLEAGAVAPLPAALRGAVTFGCFNNPAKLNDAVVALWARILQRLPSARLLLKARQFSDNASAARMRARFAAHGIAPERIELQPETARDAYFSAYDAVDIALDPFPYTGATTSIDGLWMGVPFITLRGDRMIARQGESILHNTGLRDWIAADADDYVDIALQRSADLQQLARLRGELRLRLQQSPLCDAPRFAGNLATAFKTMWQRHLQ